MAAGSSHRIRGDGDLVPRPAPRRAPRPERRPALAALVATLLAASLTAAQPVIVVAADPGTPPHQAELVSALDGQLSELGVEVVLTAGAPGGELPAPAALAGGRALLAFVLVERTPTALVVHFYEPAGTSLRERRIPVTGTGSTSIEEVAIVVRSAASALLERARGEAATPPPAPPTPPPPSPSPPVPTRDPPLHPGPLELSLAYSGQPYAFELPWQQGGRLGLTGRLGRSPLRLGADYLWTPPLRARTDEVTLALYRHPSELFFGYAIPFGGPRLELCPEGGFGADPILRRTERVGATLEGTPSSTRWSWSASTRLRLAWEPARSWVFFLTGGAEFVLNRVEHVSEQEEIVSPLRARPRLDLGVALVPPRRRPPELPGRRH